MTKTVLATLDEICRLEASLWRRLQLFVAKQRQWKTPFIAAGGGARRVEHDCRERMRIEGIGSALQSLHAKESPVRGARDGR